MTMVTATRRKSNAPLTWKALLVGGIIGSLSTVALMKHVEEIGFSTRRLSEHIEDVVIEEGSEGEGHHEIDEVRKKLNSIWSYQTQFFLIYCLLFCFFEDGFGFYRCIYYLVIDWSYNCLRNSEGAY